MKQDRFLIGILLGIGLLVVLAVSLFFAKRSTVEYVSEDKPDGVAQNYVIALYKKDYQKAYSYLADLKDKPTYLQFQQSLLSMEQTINRANLVVESYVEVGGKAILTCTVTQAGGELFDRGYQNKESATLVKQNDKWKIEMMPQPYWFWDWYQPTEKPVP